MWAHHMPRGEVVSNSRHIPHVYIECLMKILQSHINKRYCCWILTGSTSQESSQGGVHWSHSKVRCGENSSKGTHRKAQTMTTFPKTIDPHAPNIIIYQVHKFEPVISSTYSYTILHPLKTTLKPSELYLVRKASSKPLLCINNS